MNSNIQLSSSQFIPLADSEFVRFVGIYLNTFTGQTSTAVAHFDSKGQQVPNDDPRLDGLEASKPIIAVAHWKSETSGNKIAYRELIHLADQESTWYDISGEEDVKLSSKPDDIAGFSVEDQAEQLRPIIIQQPTSDLWELSVGDYLSDWETKTYTVEAFSSEDKSANLFDNPNLTITVNNLTGNYTIVTSLLDSEYRRGFWRISLS